MEDLTRLYLALKPLASAAGGKVTPSLLRTWSCKIKKETGFV